MSRECLIGHTGFVGGNLMRMHAFDACYNSKNIHDMHGKRFALLVCAAPYARKWWANQHPETDRALVLELISHLDRVQAGRVILISTVDVFPTTTRFDESCECAGADNHAYGRNRLMLEEFVGTRFGLAHIIRLPALFGPGLKKNVVFDMLHRNAVEKINPDSSFQWYDVTRLWADLQVVLRYEIRLIAMATEPIRTSAIHRRFFSTLVIGTDPSPVAHYDIRTRYAALFGGSGGYIMSQEEILERLGSFVGSERIGAA